MQLLVRLMCVISQQMVIFYFYFHSECMIEPQHCFRDHQRRGVATLTGWRHHFNISDEQAVV